MENIFIVGRTNQQEVYVASLKRPFVLDEYLIIEDESQDNPIGEIIETLSYPKIESSSFSKEIAINDSLKDIKEKYGDSPLYIGKLKVLRELQTPIKTGAKVKVPNFSEIENLLITNTPENGLTLGVIKGTEDMQKSLPNKYLNISPLFEPSRGIIKQQGIPFILDHYSFREYPHIGIYGGSGSGKSFGIRVICEEIMQKGIPGIVFDPHYEFSFTDKMPNIPEEYEYDFKNRQEIFQVGLNVGINFTEITTEELCSLLEFVAELSQPMRGAVESVHEKNDSFTTLLNRVEKLKLGFENFDKQERDREDLPDDVVLLYTKHKNKVAGTATLQAISWRLDQLNKTGIFNSDISLVEACIMKRKLAVIRGKQKLLKMLASYLVRKLYSKRKTYKDWEQVQYYGDNSLDRPQKFPPFFIIMDEAHNFAPNSQTTNPTKQILREISQEARKYGVFEIFGTQRPSLLDTTITAQLNTKIIFRTNIESDMQMIKTETNLNAKQVSRLPELTSGNAFISSATLRKTMYVRFRTSKTISPHASHPFEELDTFNSNDKLKKTLMKYLPLSFSAIPQYHSKINNDMGRALTVKEIESALEEMADLKEIIAEVSPFGKRYINK